MSETLHINERLLLSAVSKGDESAFKILLTNYKDHVYGVAFKILKTENQSEDILQEVFLKIWINKDKIVEINNFKGYITTLTSHHIYNLLRKQAYKKLYTQQLRHGQLSITCDTETLLSEDVPRFYKDLENVISSLSKQQQKVFQLSRIDGLKHNEIASILNISKETVKKHIMSSLKIVRHYMSRYKDVERILLLFLILSVK